MNDIAMQNAGGMPTTPQDMDAYYKQLAEAYAQTERRGGSTISVRNGIMEVGDQPIPGNQFAAVILDAVRLNTFYPGAFDSQNIVPPTCFAINREESQLSPHPDMSKAPHFFQPQAQTCNGCPHNEFGSGNNGKGKACTNRRRLLMLNAGVYASTAQGWVLNAEMSPDHYANSEMLTMNLAPTTLAGWGSFLRESAANYQRPPFGLVTRVYLYAHPKHGKEAIGFEPLGPTPPEWNEAIFARHQEATREIMEGYEAPAPQAQTGGAFYQQQQNIIQGNAQ